MEEGLQERYPFAMCEEAEAMVEYAQDDRAGRLFKE